MKVKFKFNIDKLKLCYHQPKGLFETLLKSPTQLIERDGYSLYILKDLEKEKQGKTPSALSVQILIIEEGKRRTLGTLTLHNQQSDFEGYCFFVFENRSFYTFLTSSRGHKYSIIPIMAEIALDLGLIFNHITALDICLDCNVNVISKVRNLVKNHQQKGLELIFNNRKITDLNQILEGWKEIYSRTCNKLIKTPSIYLQQRDENAPELVIYDKSREIAEESGKDYITEWNAIGKRCYRTEIRLKRKALQKYLNQHPLTEGFELTEIQEPQRLYDIWQTFTHRIIHFTDPQTRQPLDLVDLIET